ncbi:MAG: response regulator [Ignavibacteriales bacterium]|nr:response regulator [Ignavibacteriales bacterium]
MNDSILKNANILIVDDQQANIDVLTGLLDAKGFTNYITTKDSRQVFKLFDEFKPDLLLLDLIMPNLNGYEVMMQLKALIPANTYFPILVLTADITPESKQKALASGASDFLAKPFDLIEVDLRIKNLLKVRYLHQQLENQNQIVEEKVKERTKELEKANIELRVAKEKAEQSDKVKFELLNQMSLTESQKNHHERISELTKPEAEITQDSKTILYIEDNLSNIQLIEQILETHRPTIRLITNMYGKNAVQFAIDYKPDLILLDLSLPDIHGSEVIKLLQAEPRTAEIPIIILSAYAMSRQIEILLATGAKDYLIKPIDVVQFLKVVDERIRKSSKV